MAQQVTVYLHIGAMLMPKSFALVPRVGEIVSTGRFGKMIVVRVEHDEEGDVHLYLEQEPPSGPPA